MASIGVSIGIATAPDLSRTDTELLKQADEALYRAKSGGRNRYCFHTTTDIPPEPLEDKVRKAFGRSAA